METSSYQASPINDTNACSKHDQNCSLNFCSDKNIECLRLKEEDTENSEPQSSPEASIIVDKPNIRWDDVAGTEQTKKALLETVIFPMKFSSLFERMKMPKGVLLYGPSGTNKTYLAKACAAEARVTLFSMAASDRISKFVDREKLIKAMFSMARRNTPAIIFIDEIDRVLPAMANNQNEALERVKSEIVSFVQLQDMINDADEVLVLGATNAPWALDPAIILKFPKKIYCPLPDSPTRMNLLRNKLNKVSNKLTDENIAYLVKRTEGYSCADIGNLIRIVSYQSLRKFQNATHFKVSSIGSGGESIYEPCSPSHPQGKRREMLDIVKDHSSLSFVTINDFENSLLKAKPSVDQTELEKYEEFIREFS